MYQSIVMVEDELPLRRIVTRNLVGRGHRVREATTGAEGIALIQAELPDLVLLDINLPDQTGWDVLRTLRDRGIQVPVVVISAVRFNTSRVDEFGVLGYLPKPFPLESLLNMVAGTPTTA